jgi:hypothetical protein
VKKLFWVAIAIAITAAFFASTHPDGLDFISEKFGFAEKGVTHASPMADYSLSFLPAGGFTTALAGIGGVLIVLSLFWFSVYVLKTKKGSI